VKTVKVVWKNESLDELRKPRPGHSERTLEMRAQQLKYWTLTPAAGKVPKTVFQLVLDEIQDCELKLLILKEKLN
jgi:hypothetical protein